MFLKCFKNLLVSWHSCLPRSEWGYGIFIYRWAPLKKKNENWIQNRNQELTVLRGKDRSSGPSEALLQQTGIERVANFKMSRRMTIGADDQRTDNTQFWPPDVSLRTVINLSSPKTQRAKRSQDKHALSPAAQRLQTAPLVKRCSPKSCSHCWYPHGTLCQMACTA